MFSQLLWILAFKFEDAAKVSMYFSTELMFTFLAQYLFLGIESDYLKKIGAVLITSGVVATMGYKVIDERDMKMKTKRQDEKSDGFLKKIIFFKF